MRGLNGWLGLWHTAQNGTRHAQFDHFWWLLAVHVNDPAQMQIHWNFSVFLGLRFARSLFQAGLKHSRPPRLESQSPLNNTVWRKTENQTSNQRCFYFVAFSIIRAESEHFLNLAFALSSRSGWWPTRLDLFLHSFYCPSRWVFDYILCWFRFYSQASLDIWDGENSLDQICKKTLLNIFPDIIKSFLNNYIYLVIA